MRRQCHVCEYVKRSIPPLAETCLRRASGPTIFFDLERFIPYKPRIVLVNGDMKPTILEHIEEKPWRRISLLVFDTDLFRPTQVGPQYLLPLVVPGGNVRFDEYWIPPWVGKVKRWINSSLSNSSIFDDWIGALIRLGLT